MSILIIVSLGVTVVLELVLESPTLSGWDSTPVLSLVSGLAGQLHPGLPGLHPDLQTDTLHGGRLVTRLPGALLATLLFELGQAGFALYLDKVADLKAVYGSLSSIIVLLLWLYVSAFILILGAEYCIVRSRARSGNSSHGQGRQAS